MAAEEGDGVQAAAAMVDGEGVEVDGGEGVEDGEEEGGGEEEDGEVDHGEESQKEEEEG